MRDFNHSVNVLVKAYFDGMLIPLDCAACAVGQLMGGYRSWANLFTCTRFKYTGDEILQTDGIFIAKRKSIPAVYASEIEIKVREISGYEWNELSKVEFAFVSTTKGKLNDESMFNGLMAVVDVLADIHGIDLTAKESAKKLFLKP